jgi:hypothetical protein
VHGYPEGHTWVFNPLAWQFLFVIGGALGYAAYRNQRYVPESRRFAAVAWAVLLLITGVKISWYIHSVYDPFPALLIEHLWLIDKDNQAPLRLFHFLALAYLAAHYIKPNNVLFSQRWAHPVIRCGQNSLQIFCEGILLSVLAHFVLVEFYPGILMQLLVTMAGVALMIATATLLDWYKDLDRRQTGTSPRATLPSGPGIPTSS